MFSRIYIKRKLQKNPSEYLCLIVVMIVSMMLINIPGVFIDCINEGERLRFEEKSGGYDVVLHGADVGDLPFFDEVEGITAEYADGRINIVIAENVDREYTRNHISYVANVNDLNVSLVFHGMSDSAPKELVTLMFVVKVVFALVGMISIYFAYVLIFRKRKSEFRTLIKLGITRRQLGVTMLLELLIIYAPSLIVSTAISNLSVMTIISLFFESSDNYTGFALDYSIGSFVTLILLSVLSAVIAFGMSQRKLVSGLYGEYFEVDCHYFRYANLKLDTRETSPEKLLVRTNLLREVEFALPCGVVTVLTVLLAILMTNVGVMADNDSTDYDMTIEVNRASTHAYDVEIDAAFAILSEMEFIDKVVFEDGTTDKQLARVTFVNNCDFATAITEVEGIFSNQSRFKVTDNHSIRTEQQKNYRVIKSVLFFMSSIILLCGMVLVYVFSSLIAMKNSNTNRQLISLGISQDCLKFTTTTTVCIRAIIAYILGMFVSLGITQAISLISDIPFGLSVVSALYNTLILAVVTATHAIPIIKAVRNELKSEVLRCQY